MTTYITLTIPAIKVEPGDIIDIGGIEATVSSVGPNLSAPKMHIDLGSIGELWPCAGDVFTVRRTDPDEAVIEAMARVGHEAYYVDTALTWLGTSGGDRQRWRDVARSALAAYREVVDQ